MELLAAAATTGTAWYDTLGARIVWFAGIVVALGLLSKTRLVKWLWRQLVSDPMARWQSKVVGEVVDAKVALPNGGSSLRDAVDQLTEAQTNLTTAQNTLAFQQSVLLDWTVEQAERQTDWAEYVGSEFAQLHERMDRLCDEVGRLKSKRGVA